MEGEWIRSSVALTLSLLHNVSLTNSKLFVPKSKAALLKGLREGRCCNIRGVCVLLSCIVVDVNHCGIYQTGTSLVVYTVLVFLEL